MRWRDGDFISIIHKWRTLSMCICDHYLICLYYMYVKCEPWLLQRDETYCAAK